MAPERKVPILRTDFSVLDTEFDSIRERFEQEMRKMEDEMTKFRSELISRESNFLQKSLSSVTTGSTTSHKSEFRTFADGQDNTAANSSSLNDACANFTSSSTCSSSTSEKQVHSGGATPFKSWFDSIESPLIQDGGEGKQLKLRFDVSQYVPEEIVVKTVDNKLQVQAKHEEKSENRSVYREYNREFLLPAGTNPETIKSSLSKDGILTVEAPLPALEGATERTIPIEK